jgi:hypothetical protein
MEREPAILALVSAIDRYLAGIAGMGIADVRGGIADLGQSPVSAVTPQPVPSCGFLDQALFAITDADALAAAIASARPYLQWATYDSYPREEIGPRFPVAHAYLTIAGPAGLIGARNFELGLFLIAPRTFYRDHHHAAPELYVPLTGPHHWRFGTKSPWQKLPAHRPVWNDPWAVHATATGAAPFLGIYGWTRDVELPAKVVHAEDWAEVESRLEQGCL